MKHIIVFGAGLSSSYLIKYLLSNAKKENWQISIIDANLELAQKKVGKSQFAKAIAIDINNKEEREKLIQTADLVISLLPPTLHILVAKDCIKSAKNLITASYVSEEMKSLDKAAQKAGILLLNEIGLDPGIDHLSAMQMIHHIQKDGGEITSFKSYCGGLVAPEYDDNPWNYKFTWNPRNVILAGQATATYLENKQVKFIPPNRIFNQTVDVMVPELGKFESYANRDSLGYISPYGIDSAHTVLRGTLRRKNYCQNWNYLVNLGLTDDTYKIANSENMTYRDLMAAFLSGANQQNLEIQLSRFMNKAQTSKEFQRIKWLGLLNDEKIGISNASPAQILQHLLTQKWKLKKGELDMIVMKHEITYKKDKKNFKANSSLIVKGDDEVYTAMAKTVGLPMAIAAKLILQGKIVDKGVRIPLSPMYYEPILKELAKFDIKFIEH